MDLLELGPLDKRKPVVEAAQAVEAALDPLADLLEDLLKISSRMTLAGHLVDHRVGGLRDGVVEEDFVADLHQDLCEADQEVSLGHP